MRTLRVTVAVYALVLALGAPTLLLAAEGDPATPVEPAAPADPAAAQELAPLEPANQPPAASFVASPDLDAADGSAAVAQGEMVTLDASGSSDPEGALARFEWDLDGDGVFESDAAAGAVLTHAFTTPGTFDVRLRVTDAAGATAEERKAFTVAAPLAPEPAPEPEAADVAAPPPADPAPAPRTRSAKRQPAGGEEAEPSAGAAASASVSIVDFSFRPRSVTINVGDTVTWTNNGDEVHTATASDGSFDTGNLRSGASGSHRFTRAGTFSYICTPHPFMRGTIEVRGSGGGGSGGDDAGTAGTDDSAGGGAAGDSGAGGGSGDRLAQTGIDVLPLMGLGTLMLLMGAALGRNLPDTRP